MYSDLSLYYLKQLGIKPLIQRNQEKPVMILLPASLGEKASLLLDNILSYMPAHRLVKDKETIMSDKDAIKIIFDKAVDPNILNMLVLEHPDTLLKNPILKKSLYKKLTKINVL